jgi:hypothetical protein
MQVVPLFFQLHIGLERPIFGLVIGMLVSMALSIDTDPGDLLPGPKATLVSDPTEATRPGTVRDPAMPGEGTASSL